LPLFESLPEFPLLPLLSTAKNAVALQICFLHFCPESGGIYLGKIYNYPTAREGDKIKANVTKEAAMPVPASPPQNISYWGFFLRYFSPTLQELDVLLKTGKVLSLRRAAALLQMDEAAVRVWVQQQGVRLNRQGFIRLMQHGDSAVCRLFQRESACGHPAAYTPAQVAYIYGLQPESVEAAWPAGEDSIPGDAVPAVLDRIGVYVFG